MGMTRATVSVGPPFGNTTLSQLPYVTGVSSNDQITAASGQSHYVVYNVVNGDKSNANAVIATGTIGPNNRLGLRTARLMSFNSMLHILPEYSARKCV